MNKKIGIIIIIIVVLIAAVVAMPTKAKDLKKSTELIMEKTGVDVSNEQIYAVVYEQLETNYDSLKQDGKSLYKSISETFNTSEETDSVEYIYPTDEMVTEDLPVATIKLEGQDVAMEYALFPDYAPESVNNFISLANSGFYDGLTFHRVVCDFMAQGGDPDGTGAGGPGYSIKGEFYENGVDNLLANSYKTIAFARSADNDSAGSQFYLNTQDNDSLNGKYASFGYLISGEETLNYLNSDGVCNESDGAPLVDITIESISVDTKGVDYDEPNKL